MMYLKKSFAVLVEKRSVLTTGFTPAKGARSYPGADLYGPLEAFCLLQRNVDDRLPLWGQGSRAEGNRCAPVLIEI
jgi:hypothetical protein